MEIIYNKIRETYKSIKNYLFGDIEKIKKENKNLTIENKLIDQKLEKAESKLVQSYSRLQELKEEEFCAKGFYL